MADLYRKGEYSADTENANWYNDLRRVGQAGSNLKKFLAHARLNAGSDHCFLIRLDNIKNNDNEKDAVVRYVIIFYHRESFHYFVNIIHYNSPSLHSCHSTENVIVTCKI